MLCEAIVYINIYTAWPMIAGSAGRGGKAGRDGTARIAGRWRAVISSHSWPIINGYTPKFTILCHQMQHLTVNVSSRKHYV